jgi:hypothetical protein
MGFAGTAQRRAEGRWRGPGGRPAASEPSESPVGQQSGAHAGGRPLAVALVEGLR